MRKILIIPFCLFLLTHVSGQDQVCDATAIMNMKGEWKTHPDNIVYPDKTFSVGQYNQLRTRLDKIAGMFHQAYPEPTGIQAIWYRSIRGSSLMEKGPVPYQFYSLVILICNYPGMQRRS